MPVSVLDVASFWVGRCSRVLWRRTTSQRRRRTIMTPHEIKGVMAGVVASAVILVATFTAGGIYRNRYETETQPATISLAPGNVAVKGRSYFSQSCAQCHGRDAHGGEYAPSLLKLQISGAHMALVIRSGIKGEMPSFAKKYSEQDVTAIVAYLKTLR